MIIACNDTVSTLRHLAMLVGFASFGAIGCGPDEADEIPPDAADRYAEAMCGTYERCGCLGEWFVDDAVCRDSAVEQFELVKDWPEVRFRRQCFEDVLEYLEDDRCETVLSGAWDPVPCLVFEGSIESGGSCTPIAALPMMEHGTAGALVDDTCANGNVCVAGKCQPPPAPAVGLGESCTLETGTRCQDLALDLYCASDGVCREEVLSGGSCDTPYACQEPAQYCAGLTAVGGSGVCSGRIPMGEACDPAEMLACENAPETFCDHNGVCEGTWPGACGLLTSAPGFSGLRDWVPLQ